ncbi:MAG: sulfotransferase domain-containing protein [Pseudomonadota bacterium]
MGERPAVPLASFPKSGNTWVRSFLEALAGKGKIPDRYRHHKPGLTLPYGGERCLIYKTHDAALTNLLFGVELRHVGIVHIVRHPLDVFLSWLNYINLEGRRLPRKDLSVGRGSFPFLRDFKVDRVEDYGADEMACLLGAYMAMGRLAPHFSVVGSWQAHTRSFLHSDRRAPVHTFAYEHLSAHPEAAFEALGGLFGFGPDKVRAAMAAAETKTKTDGGFFWRKRAYGYRDILSEEHIAWFGRVRGADLTLFEEALAVSAQNLKPRQSI